MLHRGRARGRGERGGVRRLAAVAAVPGERSGNAVAAVRGGAADGPGVLRGGADGLGGPGRRCGGGGGGPRRGLTRRSTGRKATRRPGRDLVPAVLHPGGLRPPAWRRGWRGSGAGTRR